MFWIICVVIVLAVLGGLVAGWQVVRLRRFRLVKPGLYRGGQPQVAGLWFLAKVKGVKTMVNLRGDAIDLDESRFGMREVRIPLPPKTNVPELEQVQAMLTILDDAENLPAYVHCKVGADRTGFMIAMVRILRDGFSVEEALAELEKVKGEPTTELQKELLRTYTEALR